jgi:hypothetical protein
MLAARADLAPILGNLIAPRCRDGKLGAKLFPLHGSASIPAPKLAKSRSLDRDRTSGDCMSELKQQSIALWILLMLLIFVVPLALE